jgi:hypothetical protein
VKSPCSLFYIFWPGKSYRKNNFLTMSQITSSFPSFWIL